MKTRMKLGTKLILGFVGVAFVALFIGMMSIMNMRTVDRNMDGIVKASPLLDMAMEMKYNLARDMQMIMEIMAAEDLQVLEKVWEEHLAFVEGFDAAGEAIVKGAVIGGETIYATGNDRIKDIVASADGYHNDEFRPLIQKLHEAKKKYIELDEGGADKEVLEAALAQQHEFDAELDSVAQKTIDLVGGVEDAVKEEVLGKQKVADSIIARSMMVITIIMIVGFIVAIVLGILITQSITKPINNVISGLTEGSDQVASASSQVSSASQSLAEGAAEQASSIEEISSSLEEMSSMTRQNADNAEQANVLAKESRTASVKGNDSTGKMITAMKDMQAAAEQTSKIVKTIDEIAFQTNLLALNAAVEAARAGEAGKGFAVVAEEVRNLAQRAGEAAKNTSELIESSVNKTRDGAKIADEMAEALDAIMGSSSKVSELVAEIAAASKEQAQGIDQVNIAVGQMDKVTQQNASNAEESASAAEEMNSQAEAMNDNVDELAAIVGGESVDRKSKKNSRYAHDTQRSIRHSLNVSGPKKGTGTLRTAMPASARKVAAPKAEDVIKFDDSDFNDF